MTWNQGSGFKFLPYISGPFAVISLHQSVTNWLSWIQCKKKRRECEEMGSASRQGWAQGWPPAVSFMTLHLTCCSNQVILGTYLNTPSYPNFTELSGSYLLGHSWKFTFLGIAYLLKLMSFIHCEMSPVLLSFLEDKEMEVFLDRK